MTEAPKRIWVEALGCWCTISNAMEPDPPGTISQEFPLDPGRIAVSGTLTAMFRDPELFRQVHDDMVTETQARKAFLEKWSGLPVEIIDDV